MMPAKYDKSGRRKMTQQWDVIVVGGGTAGMPAATFAAERGARVLVVDAAADVGGTLHLSTGQLSAAGTRLQAAKGVTDSTDAHYDDVMRISKNTADKTLVRLAVDNAAETFDWLQDNGFRSVRGPCHHPTVEVARDEVVARLRRRGVRGDVVEHRCREYPGSDRWCGDDFDARQPSSCVATPVDADSSTVTAPPSSHRASTGSISSLATRSTTP